MNKKRSVVAGIIGLCLLFLNNAFAQYHDNEDSFFSYERFYAQLDILSNASATGSARNNIKAFVRNFAGGIYAISAGDLKEAKTRLLKARAIWPEYFGTDFLLARVNEDIRDYKLSARFYKSYLNKLKDLSEGRYRISGPLMRDITPYRIEGYNNAYASVKNRLKGHGIDLALVQPINTIPNSLRFLVIIIMLGAVCAIVIYGVIPQIKRRQHIDNPPKGSWVCKICGTYNLDIRIECEKCGEKNERRGYGTVS